jgi:hypothetical protein
MLIKLKITQNVCFKKEFAKNIFYKKKDKKVIERNETDEALSAVYGEQQQSERARAL